MKLSYLALPALLATFTAAKPTLYLAGDSTMAKAPGENPVTTGWGQFLPDHLKDITVVNDAAFGRSSRSYTTEGRFQAIIDKLQKGDYVVMSFGHNDGGGGVGKHDNGRAVCGGAANETCTSTSGEIVYTYVAYLTEAAQAMVDKGALVTIASPTPRNICGDASCAYTPPRWVEYCRKVAKITKSNFVDHGAYVAQEWKTLGKEKVDSFYPLDKLHPNAAGSTVIASMFAKAVLCSKNVLDKFVVDTVESLPGTCIE